MSDMKKIVLLVGLLVAAVGGAGESPYDFRRRLEAVHAADRRDPAAKRAADEFAFADGARIALVGKATAAVSVARDFEDYLRLAEQPEMRFIISNTTEAGIAFDPGCKFTDKPASSYPGKLVQLLYHRLSLKLQTELVLLKDLF